MFDDTIAELKKYFIRWDAKRERWRNLNFKIQFRIIIYWIYDCCCSVCFVFCSLTWPVMVKKGKKKITRIPDMVMMLLSLIHSSIIKWIFNTALKKSNPKKMLGAIFFTLNQKNRNDFSIWKKYHDHLDHLDHFHLFVCLFIWLTTNAHTGDIWEKIQWIFS